MIKVIICQKVLPYNIQTQIKPKIQTKNKLGWVGKPAKTQLNQNPGRLGWVWSGFGVKSLYASSRSRLTEFFNC